MIFISNLSNKDLYSSQYNSFLANPSYKDRSKAPVSLCFFPLLPSLTKGAGCSKVLLKAQREQYRGEPLSIRDGRFGSGGVEKLQLNVRSMSREERLKAVIPF